MQVIDNMINGKIEMKYFTITKSLSGSYKDDEQKMK